MCVLEDAMQRVFRGEACVGCGSHGDPDFVRVSDVPGIPNAVVCCDESCHIEFVREGVVSRDQLASNIWAWARRDIRLREQYGERYLTPSPF